MAECLGNLFKRESQANKGAVLIQCNKFYLRGRCWIIWQHPVREGGRREGRLLERNVPRLTLKER